jgi:mRNA interferase HigB
VRVISKSGLAAFWQSNPDSREPLKNWLAETKMAIWQTPADLKAHFRSASILQGGRVVFNIAGNKYRLVVAVLYNTQIVLIKFIGTHSEYNQVDAQTVDYKKGGM